MNKRTVDWIWLYLGAFLMVRAGQMEGFWILLIMYVGACVAFSIFTHSIDRAIDHHKR